MPEASRAGGALFLCTGPVARQQVALTEKQVSLRDGDPSDWPRTVEVSSERRVHMPVFVLATVCLDDWRATRAAEEHNWLTRAAAD